MAGLGLLGLPWSGVTTTLRCLCGTSVAADAGQGIADVRDPRLAELARVSESKRMVPATLEVSDLTRLVRGAKRGEELGGELLAHMRTTDAVVLVVRCFQDDRVAHPSGRVDPLDDAETVELELVFADQAAVERAGWSGVAKTAKSGDKAVGGRAGAAGGAGSRARAGPPRALAGSGAARCARPADGEAGAVRSRTLTRAATSEAVEALRAFGAERGIETIALDAKLEAEIAELDEGDRRAFLDDLGIEQPALERVEPGRLRGARPDPVLHIRREGDAGVDDPPRPERPGGGRQDPHRPRPRVHPGRGDRVGQAGRGGRRDRGQAPRLGARRGPRLRRQGRRRTERPLQRLSFAPLCHGKATIRHPPDRAHFAPIPQRHATTPGRTADGGRVVVKPRTGARPSVPAKPVIRAGHNMLR